MIPSKSVSHIAPKKGYKKYTYDTKKKTPRDIYEVQRQQQAKNGEICRIYTHCLMSHYTHISRANYKTYNANHCKINIMSNFIQAGENDRFKSAGSDSIEHDCEGLPIHWDNIKDGKCPKCGKMLEEFKHVQLLKCKCGFKISEYRASQLLRELEQGKVKYSSFNYSEYEDDPPF